MSCKLHGWSSTAELIEEKKGLHNFLSLSDLSGQEAMGPLEGCRTFGQEAAI